jgi:hypothetical protein
MTENEPHNPKFPEQDENGVDLSLIREALRLTPTARLRRADAAARGLEQLRSKLPDASRRISEHLKREW